MYLVPESIEVYFLTNGITESRRAEGNNIKIKSNQIIFGKYFHFEILPMAFSEHMVTTNH